MNPLYRRYHPRWHRRRMPIFWWLGKLSYVKFISRELTSLAVVYVAALVLVQVWALGRGAATWERLLELLARPWAVALHVVVALALLFHSFTWLHLAPKALVLRLGRRRIPDAAVLAAHYLAWIAASAAIAWSVMK